MPYKDKDKQREYQNNWYKQRRLDWLKDKECSHKGKYGIECTDTLEVDHKDPKKKWTHRIWSYSAAKREAELKKCQPLCTAHHYRKTITENGKTYHVPETTPIDREAEAREAHERESLVKDLEQIFA